MPARRRTSPDQIALDFLFGGEPGDCPWRPADLAQREGRALRRGNQYAEIGILRYVVEGTFDAYMWQACARKAAFISQLMNGTLAVREIDDQLHAIASATPADPTPTLDPQDDQSGDQLASEERSHPGRGAQDRREDGPRAHPVRAAAAALAPGPVASAHRTAPPDVQPAGNGSGGDRVPGPHAQERDPGVAPHQRGPGTASSVWGPTKSGGRG